MLLNVKNDIREMERVFTVVKEFFYANGICEKKGFDILVIIDELATNIVNYAFDDGQEHTFTISIEKENENVHVRLTDEGIPFDPLQKSEPDINTSLENRQIGGLGIFFVKQLATKITYERIENKNQVDILVSLKEGE